jgi:hypothetical protein
MAYDMERSLCDCLKPKAYMDIGIITDAFKQYTARKDKNIQKLMDYAAEIGVKDTARKYLEVLL